MTRTKTPSFEATDEVVSALLHELMERIKAGEVWHYALEMPAVSDGFVTADDGKKWATWKHTGKKVVRLSRRSQNVFLLHPQNLVIGRMAQVPLDPLVVTSSARGSATLDEIWGAADAMEVPA